MNNEFEKQKISDFGQKLSHLEGILGAYLPRHVFDSGFQHKLIECDKFSMSRLRNGGRRAANWELARFVEIFDLAKYGLDYRIFLEPLADFEKALRDRGVGSYGSTAGTRLREALRSWADAGDRIRISRDRRMNVGGIGAEEDDPGLVTLTHRDRVMLVIPLLPTTQSAHLVVLHDYPSARIMSSLMPSLYAPDKVVSGTTTLRLPQSSSGHLSFPVGGKPGYRCLYAVQSNLDLSAMIGMDDTGESVPEVDASQATVLMEILSNAAAVDRMNLRVTFGEYVLI